MNTVMTREFLWEFVLFWRLLLIFALSWAPRLHFSYLVSRSLRFYYMLEVLFASYLFILKIFWIPLLIISMSRTIPLVFTIFWTPFFCFLARLLFLSTLCLFFFFSSLLSFSLLCFLLLVFLLVFSRFSLRCCSCSEGSDLRIYR